MSIKSDYPTFHNTYTLAMEANAVFLTHAHTKKLKKLLGVSIENFAYLAGLSMEAHEVLKRDIKMNKGLYPESRIRIAEEELATRQESSISDLDINKKLIEIQARGLLAWEIPPLDYATRLAQKRWKKRKKDLRKDFSFAGKINKRLFPSRLRELMRRRTRSIVARHSLQNRQITNLQSTAFEEILKLLNRKGIPSRDELVIVRFLEQCIEEYYPAFQQDLGLNIQKTQSLLSLRKRSREEFNAICWRCGRKLLKRDNRHYCVRRENRSCYEVRLEEAKNLGFRRGVAKAIGRTKNYCDGCGKHPAPLDHIHKHRRKEMQFCSRQCWERFRKRGSREL